MLQGKARKSYQNLFEEENNRKCQYARSLYNSFSVEKKDKRWEYAREKYRYLSK